MAVDTPINDTIITGDLNLDYLLEGSERNIEHIARQYNMIQLIDEPTHYTESSSSLIDVILASKPESVLYIGVGDAFLDLPIRYHCPVFCLF